MVTYSTLRTRARKFRKQMTKAEQKIWFRIRDRQLAPAPFRRQHVCGKYILDFYCAKAKLVVEIDGITHTSKAAIEYDSKRTRFIENQGLTVIRFWNHEVYADPDDVVEKIFSEVKKRLGD